MFHSKTNDKIKEQIRNDMAVDGKIRLLICANQRCFIIFLLWAGPDVAVKAIICAFGHNDLSSPIFENHARNGSSCCVESPLLKKDNNKLINCTLFC
jgi:hypothetical protein